MTTPAPLFDTADLLQHAGWMRALARTLVRDPERADDLVQDAWVTALTRPPASGRRGLGPWLAAVLRNGARELGRSEARRRAREARVASAREAAAPSVQERVELHGVLLEAIRSLDEPHAQVLLLRYFDELPPRASARRLELPRTAALLAVEPLAQLGQRARQPLANGRARELQPPRDLARGQLVAGPPQQ
ncbi:MAG: sigma-70 family RNA polymerase sigma factor, partial [Planctomycetota bacterium]